MSTLKAGKLQHPDAANSSIEFDASGNITKFVGPSGGADGNVLTKSGTTTAWAALPPIGAVLVETIALSASSSVDVNNCFTSDYENYLIIGSGTASAAGDLRLQLRASGTTTTSSTYRGHAMNISGGSYGGTTFTTTYFRMSVADANWWTHTTIFGPNLNTRTPVICLGGRGTTAAVDIFNVYAMQTDTAVYDGITVATSSGTASGNLYVYGLDK